MDTAESTDSSSSEASSQSSDSFDGGASVESQGSPDASQGNGQQAEGNNVPRGTNGEQKQESRYERTKRERKEFLAQKAQFDAERQQFAQERAQLEQQRIEASKPKRDYSLAQLKKFRNEWADEGKDELVARADQEIKAMEEEERAGRQTLDLPRAGTPEHAQQWRAMEQQLKGEDPDFLKAGTRLDQEIRKLFAGPNADAYRSHPQGIYAAYSEAKKIVLTEENKSLRSELQKVREELKRATGLTSIGAGVPGRVGTDGQKEFKNLTSTEMRKRLLADKRPGMSNWL
jgi:hypothetical protein